MLHMEKLTPDAESRLSGLGDSCVWERMKYKVQYGQAQLFLVEDDTYLILEKDRDALVILAIVGTHGIAAMQTLISLAKEMKLNFVWFKTERHGMIRFLKRFNPIPFENGYRVNV